MARRSALVFLLVATMLLAAPALAFGWANGPTPDGFGTHDWVLYEAIKRAPSSWVATEAALLTTDDPDSLYETTDRVNHLYLVTGPYRGGPDTIVRLYREAHLAYRSGDTTAASQYIGLLSHYYADLCVPFHTRDAAADTPTHLLYEYEAQLYTDAPGENAGWITTWSRGPVDDVRQFAVQAAYSSRATYGQLYPSYLTGGFNESTQMVTRAVLSRAVNDLADIIRSVPSGSGLPSAIKTTTSMGHYWPASTTPTITAYVKCTDAKGLPVEGVRVDYTFQYANVTTTTTTYSKPDGYARAYALGAELVTGTPVAVSIATPQSSRRAYSTTSTWFVPTDQLGLMRTTISNRYPSNHTTVTVETLCLSRDGAPMPGLQVTYRWRHRTTTLEKTVITDAQGIARQTRDIGASTKGYRVYVDATVPAGGVTRTETTDFKPVDNVATMNTTATPVAPTRDTTVTVRTTCLDAEGRPIAGAPVTWAWRYRSGTTITKGTTDAKGVAKSARNIRSATRGYAVHVTATVPSGSSTKQSMTWFSPR